MDLSCFTLLAPFIWNLETTAAHKLNWQPLIQHCFWIAITITMMPVLTNSHSSPSCPLYPSLIYANSFSCSHYVSLPAVIRDFLINIRAFEYFLRRPLHKIISKEKIKNIKPCKATALLPNKPWACIFHLVSSTERCSEQTWQSHHYMAHLAICVVSPL